jgi:hypothetical protein
VALSNAGKRRCKRHGVLYVQDEGTEIKKDANAKDNTDNVDKNEHRQ